MTDDGYRRPEPLPDHVDGGRLRLRTYRAGTDDVDRLARAVSASVEHLRPWMAWIDDEPMARADREALIVGWEEGRQAGGDAVYGIFEGDDLIGGTGYHVRIGAGALELGYWVHVDHTGEGVATEASRILTDHAFTMDDIERVVIAHAAANRASRRVPEKLGFTPLVPSPDPNGDPAWQVTRAEWEARPTP